MYVPRAMYSLRMSFWTVPRREARRNALLLGDGDVETQEDRRSSVDGHRRRNGSEREPLQEDAHVFDGVDGDAYAADLAARANVVRVAPHLGRQVERDA